MRRAVRWALLLTLAALHAAGTGCGFARRPYAHDPLLRNGAGTWGNAELARGPDFSHFREPLPPHAPKPADLPTMEWETARVK